MNVFVHTIKDGSDKNWVNVGREFKQLPAIGEHFALAAQSAWYEVLIVVHCPFEATYDAEIYAVEVDHLGVIEGVRQNLKLTLETITP